MSRTTNGARPPRERTLAILAVLSALVLVALPREALAHPLAPALLEVSERLHGAVDVRFKTSLYSPSRAAAEALAPRLPAHCRRTGEPATRVEKTARIQEFRILCDSPGLVGATFGVEGLGVNGIDALLRVAFEDGRTLGLVLRAGAPTAVLPGRPSRFGVVSSYAMMGVRHISTGPDHLLFVFGLFLLVVTTRQLLLTLTAFTLGHSITLSLAALGFVTFPTRPIELLIALSVLILAVQLAKPHGTARRATAGLAVGFGLLHGFGFAGALAEIGLPHGEIPLALLAFNVGIEVGQVAFVALIAAVSAALAALAQGPHPRARVVAVYTMGALAASWCIERGMALVP